MERAVVKKKLEIKLRKQVMMLWPLLLPPATPTTQIISQKPKQKSINKRAGQIHHDHKKQQQQPKQKQ